MAMETVKGHGFRFDDHPGRDAALASVRQRLSASMAGGRLDEVMAEVRVEQVWWSPTIGFGHDCAKHRQDEASPETCPADMRLTTMALGLPVEVTDGERPRATPKAGNGSR